MDRAGSTFSLGLFRRTLKEAGKLINSFTVFAILLHLVRMITGLICIQWITPEQMGVWQLMLLLESYMMFARFGVFNALNRELPYYLGRKRTEKAMMYHDTAEGYAILVSVLFLVGISASVFIYNPTVMYWKESILVFAAYLPVKFYSGFIELTFRSGRDFQRLSFVQMVLMVFTILSVLLVYYFGYDGYLVRILLLALIGLFLMMWFRPFRFKATLNTQYFRQLFRMGMPLFVSNYGQAVINSFPGMLILIFGNIAMLGLYYPVNIIINFGAMVPGIISTYIYPQTSFEFGSHKDEKKVIQTSLKAGLYSAVLMLPVIGVIFFMLPPLFIRFAPEYIDAIIACKWALLFSLVSCMSLFFNPFAILKAWKPMYIYLAIAGIVSWGIPYVVLLQTKAQYVLLVLVLSWLGVKLILAGVNYLFLRMIPMIAKP